MVSTRRLVSEQKQRPPLVAPRMRYESHRCCFCHRVKRSLKCNDNLPRGMQLDVHPLTGKMVIGCAGCWQKIDYKIRRDRRYLGHHLEIQVRKRLREFLAGFDM
jgi:hypothetical protein